MIDRKLPYDTPGNHDALNQFVESYDLICSNSELAKLEANHPLGARPNITHIVGVSGLGKDAIFLPGNHPDAGIFGYDRKLRYDDVPNKSSTLLLMEAGINPGHWWEPGFATTRGLSTTDNNLGPEAPFGLRHHNDARLLPKQYSSICSMADGSVRSISDKIDPEIILKLARLDTTAKQSLSSDWQ